MAIVITGKNYTLIDACESLTPWDGLTDALVDDFFKQGSYCLGMELWGSGTNDHTLTGSWDLSGTKHLRLWWMTTVLKELDTDTNGGFQIGVSDGANTGFYKVSGSTTYPGGWFNPVIDLSRDVDSGTKPTMSAITSIIFRWVLTAGAKKTQSCWVDHICVCDGLTVYGDDGDYFDYDDIYLADNATTLGIGIIRKIGGQYFLTGSIEYGDSAGVNGCKFQSKSQVVVFEDRPVNAGLYSFDVVDNGTGTTEFILGAKSGTAGIQGCTIRVEDEDQIARFDVTGSGTNVDNFKLYASTFFGADSVDFPPAAGTVEILGCSYEACGQVNPDSANTDDCFFINTTNTDGALLWNESVDITDCSFIANETGAAIEMPSAVGTPYTYDGLLFSGNTYDVYNSSGSAIVINKTNGSNPTTYSGSGVTFSASFNHIITGLELNTEVTYVTAGTSTELYHVENASVSDGDGKYKTTYSHGGGASVDVLIHHINFKPDISNIIGITLPNAEATVKVQMFEDPDYYNPA
jgi:hypothetical protein